MPWSGLFFVRREKHNSTRGIKNSFFIIACLRRQSSSRAERVFIHHQAPLLSTRTIDGISWVLLLALLVVNFSLHHAFHLRHRFILKLESLVSKSIVKTRGNNEPIESPKHPLEPKFNSNSSKIDGERVVFICSFIYDDEASQNWRCWNLSRVRERNYSITHNFYTNIHHHREIVMSIVGVEDENEREEKRVFRVFE